jgi:hypothetical protein
LKFKDRHKNGFAKNGNDGVATEEAKRRSPMTKKITTVSLITFALLVTVDAGRLMHPTAEAGSLKTDGSDLNLQCNAAFRDGAYQGKLAAAHEEREHLSIGRWNDPSDRDAFVAGYRQSYHRQQAASK